MLVSIRHLILRIKVRVITGTPIGLSYYWEGMGRPNLTIRLVFLSRDITYGNTNGRYMAVQKLPQRYYVCAKKRKR